MSKVPMPIKSNTPIMTVLDLGDKGKLEYRTHTESEILFYIAAGFPIAEEYTTKMRYYFPSNIVQMSSSNTLIISCSQSDIRAERINEPPSGVFSEAYDLIDRLKPSNYPLPALRIFEISKSDKWNLTQFLNAKGFQNNITTNRMLYDLLKQKTQSPKIETKQITQPCLDTQTQKQDELEAIYQKINDELQSKLDKAEQASETLAEEKKNAEIELNRSRRSLTVAQTKITTLENTIKDKDDEIKKLNEKLKQSSLDSIKTMEESGAKLEKIYSTELEAKNSKISEQQAEITQHKLNKRIAECTERAQQTTIKKQTEQIEKLKRTISNQDKSIEEKEGTISEQSQTLITTKADLEKATAELNKFKTSKGGRRSKQKEYGEAVKILSKSGKTQKEIAEQLKISIATVKRILRAKRGGKNNEK